jgi:hypothetical protein
MTLTKSKPLFTAASRTVTARLETSHDIRGAVRHAFIAGTGEPLRDSAVQTSG